MLTRWWLDRVVVRGLRALGADIRDTATRPVLSPAAAASAFPRTALKFWSLNRRPSWTPRGHRAASVLPVSKFLPC